MRAPNPPTACATAVGAAGGDTPAFRLRVGSLHAWDELPMPVTDAALLLVGNQLPVEVVTPSVPDDWDAALAELVAERP